MSWYGEGVAFHKSETAATAHTEGPWAACRGVIVTNCRTQGSPLHRGSPLRSATVEKNAAELGRSRALRPTVRPRRVNRRRAW